MALLAGSLLIHAVLPLSLISAGVTPEKIPEIQAKPSLGALALVPMSNPAWLTDLRKTLEALLNPTLTPAPQGIKVEANAPQAKAVLAEIAKEVPPATVAENPAGAEEKLARAYENGPSPQEDPDAPLVYVPAMDEASAHTVHAMLAMTRKGGPPVVATYAGVRLRAKFGDDPTKVEKPWIDHLVREWIVERIRVQHQALHPRGVPVIMRGSAPPAPKAPWEAPPDDKFYSALRAAARAEGVSLEHYALTKLLDKNNIRQFVADYLYSQPLFATGEIQSAVRNHEVQPGTGEIWLAALAEARRR